LEEVVFDETRAARVSRRSEYTTSFHVGLAREAVGVFRSACTGSTVAKNVSVLWVDYAAIKAILPGMWEVVWRNSAWAAGSRQKRV